MEPLAGPVGAYKHTTKYCVNCSNGFQDKASTRYLVAILENGRLVMLMARLKKKQSHDSQRPIYNEKGKCPNKKTVWSITKVAAAAESPVKI